MALATALSAWQRTLPSCDREAVDPSLPGILCQFPFESVGSGEPVTDPETSAGSDPRQDISPDKDRLCSLWTDTAPAPLDELAEIGGDNGGSSMSRGPSDNRALPSGDEFYPAWLRSHEWWVNWVLAFPFDDDGAVDRDATPTKQPVAPYQNHSAEPTLWNDNLLDDEHPATDVEHVEQWEGARVGVDLPPVERVLSDRLGVGIIIPVGQHTRDERTVALIDWDDVRNPETGEIHPVCARALRECDGYAEISQSGEGIHQYVFGEIPGGLAKFIRHIDDEPFVGDDLPMVEMYSSGRLSAMTGRHVAGTDRDVADGQELIDRLVWEYGTAGNNATDTPTDPYASERDAENDQDDGGDPSETTASGSVPSHAAVGDAVREAVEYDGGDPAEWDIPDEDSIEYYAVLRARERSDDLPSTANWELIGYAAAFGHRDGRRKGEVLADLEAHPTPQYGFDRQRAAKEVRGMWRKCENDDYDPPSHRTLVERGILPPEYGSGTSGDAEPLFAAPLERLKHLSPTDARRAAKKRGLDWPSTADVRDRLETRVFRAMNDAETVVIDAPTGSGKSHIVATTPWLNHADVTDGRPVVQLAPTRKARDENAAKSSDAGVRYATLKGRDELCPICAGDHDPTPDGEDDPDVVYTVDGRPVSEWIDEQCDGKHLAISHVHAELPDRIDQDVDELVCERDGGDCPTRTQWTACHATTTETRRST